MHVTPRYAASVWADLAKVASTALSPLARELAAQRDYASLHALVDSPLLHPQADPGLIDVLFEFDNECNDVAQTLASAWRAKTGAGSVAHLTRRLGELARGAELALAAGLDSTIDRMVVARQLIARGAAVAGPVNGSPLNAPTPLDLAVRHGDAEMATLMLETHASHSPQALPLRGDDGGELLAGIVADAQPGGTAAHHCDCLDSLLPAIARHYDLASPPVIHSLQAAFDALLTSEQNPRNLNVIHFFVADGLVDAARMRRLWDYRVIDPDAYDELDLPNAEEIDERDAAWPRQPYLAFLARIALDNQDLPAVATQVSRAIRAFVTAGIDLNAPLSNDVLPLAMAAMLGDAGVVLALLDCGANAMAPEVVELVEQARRARRRGSEPVRVSRDVIDNPIPEDDVLEVLQAAQARGTMTGLLASHRTT